MLAVRPLTALFLLTAAASFIVAALTEFWPAYGLAGASILAGTFLQQRDVQLAGSADIRLVKASRGWQANTFELDGLEADGEALYEFTQQAALHGYRREPGPVLHSWRFVRDQGPTTATQPTAHDPTRDPGNRTLG